MNKIGGIILQISYLLIVIAISLYMVSYNRFGFSTYKNYTIFVANNSNQFNDGTLIIIEKDKDAVIKGDVILFYDSYNATKKVLEEEVISKEITNEKETTFFLTNEKFLSSSYLIGRADDAVTIPLIGYVVSLLSSSIGYFIFVIVPVSIIFVIQLKYLIEFMRGKGNVDVAKN